MASDPATGRSYAQRCGIAGALDVVGERWAALVIRDLLVGPLRFGDLLAGLPGIGSNTLTARLKQLEAAGVVARRPVPLPDRGTVYELTGYGRELEPVLLALGRWGERRMALLPAAATSRSRWLAVAMLAFRAPGKPVDHPLTWLLRLDDGPYTVHAESDLLTVTAGETATADLTIAVGDQTWYALLTRRLRPAAAITQGLLTVHGDRRLLRVLLDRFMFPTQPSRG